MGQSPGIIQQRIEKLVIPHGRQPQLLTNGPLLHARPGEPPPLKSKNVPLETPKPLLTRVLIHERHRNAHHRQRSYSALSARPAAAWRWPRTPEGLPPGATALPICCLTWALTSAQDVLPTG